MTSGPHHRSPEQQAELRATLTDLFERRIVFNETLALKVESLEPPAPRLRFDMRDQLVGHYLYNRLHGGVTSSALDAAGGLALMVAIAEKHAGDEAAHVLQRFSRIGTLDLRIDFLRPGIGSFFIAAAEVTRLGSRVASTQMRLVNDAGVLVATGAAVYVIN